MPALRFDLSTLKHAYACGAATPIDVVAMAYERIAADDRDGLWITLRDRADALAAAQAVMTGLDRDLPLWGVPFSVKDNIDVAGLPTTAACPAYAYRPERSATVIRRLEQAGAICIGKVNLDQFATGLNGTRSPYGVCGAAFDPAMVAGGSSSGSAVSVALQHVSFSIGTDTGGSGRIPAGINNVIGLKPTKGTLSLDGIVPCSETLDCPSVFALAIEDACTIAAHAFGHDPADPSLRDDAERTRFGPGNAGLPGAILVPGRADRVFFGNSEGEALFDRALEIMGAVHTVEEVDFAPFFEAGALVFDGPWIADRYAGIGAFIEDNPGAVLETTRGIVLKAKTVSGADVFAAMDRLKSLKAATRPLFGDDRLLIVPTVGPRYSIKDLLAEPVERNTHLGAYSYFVNPLDLCALSVPCTLYGDGMPFGLTVIGPAHADQRVARLALEIARLCPLEPGRARP